MSFDAKAYRTSRITVYQMVWYCDLVCIGCPCIQSHTYILRNNVQIFRNIDLMGKKNPNDYRWFVTCNLWIRICFPSVHLLLNEIIVGNLPCIPSLNWFCIYAGPIQWPNDVTVLFSVRSVIALHNVYKCYTNTQGIKFSWK